MMEITDSNFFTTQIPNSEKCDEQQNNKSARYSRYSYRNDYKNPQIRIRQVKSQAKKVVNIYNQSLQQYLKIKNSIEKCNSKTQKLRHQFVKLYGNKKSKFNNHILQQKKRQTDEQHKHCLTNRVRCLKLDNELSVMYTKNECEIITDRRKQQNKKHVNDINKQLKLIRIEEVNTAKQKRELIKNGQTEQLKRRTNRSTMIETRAHHNYLLKVNQQIEILNSYTNILGRFNELLPSNQIVNKADIQQFNRTFFTTSRNTFN